MIGVLNMKKEFECPELIIVLFDNELSTLNDILTVSNPAGGGEGEEGEYNL